MSAQLEEIIFFLQFSHISIARIKCAIWPTVFFREKSLFLRRIKSRVARLVKMAGGVELRERGLDKFLVARLRGADEVVIRQLQFFGDRLPVRRERVAVFLRIFLLCLRRLLDLLAVLVEAGQKKNLLAQAAPRAGDDVGDDFFVGMAEMRLAVHIIKSRAGVKR